MTQATTFKVRGTLLGFGAAVVVWVDGDGLLPSKQQTSTLHIGTHIFSESSKDSTQNHTRYQLTSHLQSNTLELDDKAQTLSYEQLFCLLG
jgi:hypothetical protein